MAVRPTVKDRWAGDGQGIGVSSATQATGPVEQLLHDMSQAGWVAEDPAGHLRPKLDAWLRSQSGANWSVGGLSLDDATLIIDVVWRAPSGRMRDLRADAYALIGSFAEDSSHVSQRIEGPGVLYDVATGQPAGDFGPHGHLVTVRATGPDVERAMAGLRVGGRAMIDPAKA